MYYNVIYIVMCLPNTINVNVVENGLMNGPVQWS